MHFDDCSGTVTAGGTSQMLAKVKQGRKLFLFQNLSTGDLWINEGKQAVAAQPSILIASGQTILLDQHGTVPSDYMHVFGATTGQAYTCKQA